MILSACTGKLIFSKLSSASYFLYCVILSAFFSTGCNAAKIAHWKHLLLSFAGFTTPFFVARSLGSFIFPAPVDSWNCVTSIKIFSTQ
jgi:hypothetical protein